MKLFPCYLTCFFAFSCSIFPVNDNFNRSGYILNSHGQKCYYTQEIKKQFKYFYGDLPGDTAVLTFKDKNCMTIKTKADEIVNKTMINNIISKWHSHPDANFKTNFEDLYTSSTLQKIGHCIQSKQYPSYGIVIDYVTSGNAIALVLHTGSIQACKNK